MPNIFTVKFIQIDVSNDSAQFDVSIDSVLNDIETIEISYGAMSDAYMPIWHILYLQLREAGITDPEEFHKKLIKKYHEYQKLIWDMYNVDAIKPKDLQMEIDYDVYRNDFACAFTLKDFSKGLTSYNVQNDDTK